MSSVDEHRSEAPDEVRVSIITVSDTRTLESDRSGQTIERLLRAGGYSVATRVVVTDDTDRVDAALVEQLEAADVDAVILNGGTGLGTRDGTVEVVRRRLDRELPGFGELFRMLSWDQVGAAAMLSRAVGGSAAGKAVFSLPGSTKAVELAMEKLLVPELGHVLRELRR